jgi:hypothetical protein
MMELAGHIRPATRAPKKPTKRPKTSKTSALVEETLTAEEEDELLKYLAFIRMRKGKK